MTFGSLKFGSFLTLKILVIFAAFLVEIETSSTTSVEQIGNEQIEDGKCGREKLIICEPVNECAHNDDCGGSEFCCEGVCVLKPTEGLEKCAPQYVQV